MSCTYDTFELKVKNKQFADILEEERDDCFGYLYLEKDDFRSNIQMKDNGLYVISFDGEPIYGDDDGEGINDLVHRFIEAVPESEFQIIYTYDYDDTSDFHYLQYFYKDGVLSFLHRNAEWSGDTCPNCDKIFETPLIALPSSVMDKGYKCEQCGKMIYFKEEVEDFSEELSEERFDDDQEE